MKEYTSMHLVKSEDLNHHGTLFAARTASWFVEAAFATAACAHKNSEDILCRNLHGMAFDLPVRLGDVVNFHSRIALVGKTSLMVYVKVCSELTERTAVEGFLTFVTVNPKTGKPFEHELRLDETSDPEELRIREKAAAVRAARASGK